MMMLLRAVAANVLSADGIQFASVPGVAVVVTSESEPSAARSKSDGLRKAPASLFA